MSNTYIFYNNKVIPEPTPFVLLERENLYYNQYWGNSDKITLNGQITGYGCSPFNEITSGQQKILNIFNKNFGNLEVFEPSVIQPNTFPIQSGIYRIENIRSIDFTGSFDFGRTVALNYDGNIAVVGDPYEETGKFFVINRDTNEEFRVTGSVTGSSFAYALTINSKGTIIATSAPTESSNVDLSGKVYIYSRVNGTLNNLAILTGDSNFFGHDISINASGDRLIVGASSTDILIETGAVFIFTGNNTNWNQTAKIISDVPSGNFGNVVSLNFNGNIAIVGEYNRNLGTGAACIITGDNNSWQKAKILNPDGPNAFNFGNSVAINSTGDIVAIGSELENQNSGVVYIFTGLNTWNKAAVLSGDKDALIFGHHLAINSSGNILAVSALSEIAPNGNQGVVYIFTGNKNIWNKYTKIYPSDENLSTIFGEDIDINSIGNTIIIGKELDINNQGVANIYSQDDFYEKIYQNSGIVIRSINFDNSNYGGIVDYSIELDSIRVSGNVLDPVNEFQFSENENKTVTLSHSISAKGINTNLSSAKSNALNNAISFVRLNTGLANVPSTKFISGNINKFYLQNFSESIDRLNGSYSIQETYINNYLDNSLSGNLTYTIDVNSGSESNFLQINVRGQYKGPRNGNISDLRGSLNVTGLITGTYSGYFNPIPIEYNITENTGENSINFDYSFDNINLPNPYYRYESNISKDEIQQIYNVQVRGEIVARGNRNYRYFLSTGNIINLTGQFISVASGILTGFKDFNGDTYQSNLRLLNITIDENPNEGTVSANASYDDKFMPSGNATDGSYNISVEAARWYMNNQATCNIKGFHIINDFDITTLPKISINTSLKYKNLTGINNENILRSEIKNITNNIIPNNYNFNTKLQDSESYTKKYNNFNSITDISYKLDKVDLSNQNGLLPKFNTI